MMRCLLRWSVITLALLSCVFGQERERRPMTVDDQLDMVDVGDALISPDGGWVLFSKSELDWKENKRKTTWHKIPAAGGEAFQFIGEAGASSVEFSPQGSYLSFLRPVGEDKDKKNQLFVMRADGGEAVQQTKHKTAVRSYRWANDESKIFFVADRPRSKEEEKAHKDGYDAIWVDEGPNGQREGEWRHLWMFELASKESTPILEDQLIISSFDVSPDARRIIYVARTENRRNQQHLAEIYVVNVEDKQKTRLTSNNAPEGRLLWAPDGASVAYMAPDDQEWELRNDKLWIIDPDTGQHRLLSGSFDGNIRGLEWSPDGRAIFFNGLQRTDSNLYELDVENGAVQQLTNMTGSVNVRSFSRDRGTYVYSFSDLDTPEDLWVGRRDGSDPVRLTKANPWIESDLLLARGEVIQWESSDGLEIEGLLLLPPDHSPGARVPLILNIHGGPAGVFTNSFSPPYHIYAGLGYASLCPNVRGSSGYSDELLRGNMKDIGGGDYRDLMTGVDSLIEQGYADPDRMGLRGWSYGGILGGWTITQTDRFKAASIGAMVSDWTSEYGPGFNHDVRLWYIGGTPWENPEEWRQKSPLTHVAKVQTPTIIFHGINDTTDTEPQSMMFFTALKDQGKEVRYLRFPREPHGFREPRHQRTRYIEEIRWMQKYVLGEEWTPWEREVEADETESEKDTAPDDVEVTEPSGSAPGS